MAKATKSRKLTEGHPACVEVWSVEAIEIGERRRKDMGDIRGLATSIEDVGLLHPIVVTPHPTVERVRLVAGQRRLAAMRLLGWTEIPVHVVDIADIAAGELQENTVRKDFLPSEMVAIYEAVKEFETAKATERRQATQAKPGQQVGQTVGGGNFPPPKNGPVGKTRDVIGTAAGVSGRTIDKAAAVVQAAREEPEKYGHLVDKMDQTGKVNAAHKQMRETKRHEEIREQAAAASSAPAAAEAHIKSIVAMIYSMDALRFLRAQATASVDMTWMDPPYNIASHGGGTKVGDSYESFGDSGDGWDSEQWPDQEAFLQWMAEILLECDRVLKPTGNLVVCTDRLLISHVADLCRLRTDGNPLGLSPRNVLAWHKSNAAPNARKNFDSSLELAVWASKGGGATFRRPPGGQAPSVWSGPFVCGNKRVDWPHPTSKPVDWIKFHLEVLSVAGHVVMDPFAGSGATVEAALSIGRTVIANDQIPPRADGSCVDDPDRYALMSLARARQTIEVHGAAGDVAELVSAPADAEVPVEGQDAYPCDPEVNVPQPVLAVAPNGARPAPLEQPATEDASAVAAVACPQCWAGHGRRCATAGVEHNFIHPSRMRAFVESLAPVVEDEQATAHPTCYVCGQPVTPEDEAFPEYARKKLGFSHEHKACSDARSAAEQPSAEPASDEVLCAECGMDIYDFELEQTPDGPMHSSCARDHAAAETRVWDCSLCGRQANDTTGADTPYGRVHFTCCERAVRLGIAEPLVDDIACPRTTCGVDAGIQCKRMKLEYHAERHEDRAKALLEEFRQACDRDVAPAASPQSEATEAIIRTIACTHCVVPAGEPCKLMYGPRPTPHAERERAFLRTVKCPSCGKKKTSCTHPERLQAAMAAAAVTA